MLQIFEVMNSSIVTTKRSPSFSRFFKARQRTPVTPHWLPFSFTKPLPNIPAPKRIRGTFALFCWNFDGFHLRLHHKMH
jgi:hypothetical protein